MLLKNKYKETSFNICAGKTLRDIFEKVDIGLPSVKGKICEGVGEEKRNREISNKKVGQSASEQNTCRQSIPCFRHFIHVHKRGPNGSVGEESTCNTRDTGGAGLIPGKEMATHSCILA